MTSKNDQQQTPAVVDDAATEKLKERARELGLIVNAGGGQKHGTIASQTKTTRRLDQTVKQEADVQMADPKKGKRK